MTIVGPILILILLIALGWNYFKLLLECVERYIVVGVRCYTSQMCRRDRLMRSYARNQGGQVPNTVIAQDIAANDETPISEETVASYVNALRKIFVVEDMPAWNPNLRSKTAIRSSDTRYYIDPSIAAAALGIGPNDLVNDLHTFGFLFETLCVRDLRVFADALNGEVYHYRDKDGQECDAVIHLRNGKYGLIEMKLGGDTLIEEGVRSLKSMAAKIDTDKMHAPSFLMVLTGTGDYAYRRHDGVYVVPLGRDVYKRQGLRHAVIGHRDNDIAGVLENIVYLELLRRGWTVHIGKQDVAEVDFVANRTDERLYIQVCYVLTPENTEREFGPLEGISDNYEKLVLSTDTLLRINRGGIRQKNIVDFLLET